MDFCQALFKELSDLDKLRLCREEISVIALERFLVPVDFRASVGSAWYLAIKQLVTTMTRGWFPRFIVTHLLELSKPDPEHDFVKLFKEKLERKDLEE